MNVPSDQPESNRPQDDPEWASDYFQACNRGTRLDGVERLSGAPSPVEVFASQRLSHYQDYMSEEA